MADKNAKKTTPQTPASNAPAKAETTATATPQGAAPLPPTPPAETPAPATPQGAALPASAPTEARKPESKEEKKLTLAEVMAMGTDVLAKFLKSAIKLTVNIKTAQETEKDNRKDNAKAVADLKRRHAAAKDSMLIPPDWTFPKYFEMVVGGKCPGRLQSLGGLFNMLVMLDGHDRKPLLTETVYDNAALDWLEKANAILNAAIAANGENWKSCADVTEMLNILNSPGDAAKKLDAIRKRQKGETDAAAQSGETAVSLTPERAVEFLVAFYADQANLVLTKPANAKELFCQGLTLAERFSELATLRDNVADGFKKSYDAETMKAWYTAHKAGVASHVEVITSHPETPKPATAPDAPLLPPLPAETPAAKLELEETAAT